MVASELVAVLGEVIVFVDVAYVDAHGARQAVIAIDAAALCDGCATTEHALVLPLFLCRGQVRKRGLQLIHILDTDDA